VDLNRLRIRGLETAVHMALIREVHGEPKKQSMPIVVLTVLLLFGERVQN
jgi:hypothetical protein